MTNSSSIINIKLAKKYPYLVVWHKDSGSYPYYIQRQLEDAEKTNAPSDATFYRDDKQCWARFSEITKEGREEWITQFEAKVTKLKNHQSYR